jgi:hypothetical protein
MTAQEWAKSAAGSCRKLNQLGLERMKLNFRTCRPAKMQCSNLCCGAVLWACKRWAHCKNLSIDVWSHVEERDAVSLATYVRQHGPHYVQKLQLYAGHYNVAMGCVFEALLASLKSESPLEVLDLGLRIECLPELVNLKELYLHDVCLGPDIACLVGNLPCLESLYLSVGQLSPDHSCGCSLEFEIGPCADVAASNA